MNHDGRGYIEKKDLVEFLKDNLTIETTKETIFAFGLPTRRKIEVRLLISGKVISSDIFSTD